MSDDRWVAAPQPARSRVTPTIAPTAMIAGHLGALEASYFLAGMRPQTVGRLYHQNLLVYDHQEFAEPTFWDRCPACGPGGAFPAPQGVPRPATMSCPSPVVSFVVLV